jgi:hypothetical protein
VRIGLFGLLAIRLSRPLYVQLGGQPQALYRPISFMKVMSGMPSTGVILVVDVVAVLAAILCAMGVVVRTAMPIAIIGGLFLNGLWTSIGQPMHNDTLLLLSLIPLLLAPVADAWSASNRQDPGRTDEISRRFGWPVRTAMIVVAVGYFFTGIYKLVLSGPAWVFSDNLRWVMYRISDENVHPIAPALFIAAHPLLVHLAAAMTLIVEIGFPIVLVRPRAAWFFLPAAVFLHAAIGLTMHLDYSAWAATAIIVFIPWDVVADRWSVHGRDRSLGPQHHS